LYVSTTQQSGNDASVNIVVEMGDPNDPEDRRARKSARAYEYGSGIHGAKGKTYVIEPKKSNVLAFVWPNHVQSQPLGQGKIAGYFAGPDNSGRNGPGFYFHWVDHPGVAARPYLQPAINSMMDRITEELKYEFVNLFIGSKFEAEVKLDWFKW
jgi:hypothetical protein